MAEMKNWYDKEEDILGVRIKDGKYWKSIELPNGVIIDISREGDILGMEIFHASKVFSGDARKIVDSAEEA